MSSNTVRSWAASVLQSIIGGAVLTFLLKHIPEDGAMGFWQRHWPEMCGAIFALGVFATARLWEMWTRLLARVEKLEQWKDAGGGDTAETLAKRALRGR